MSGGKTLDQIEIDLRNYTTGDLHTIYIDVFDNSLSHKWLKELNNIIDKEYHLEKNYCFMGWTKNDRNGQYIIDCINKSIDVINASDLNYKINDYFSLDNTITDKPVEDRDVGRNLIHDRMNHLHLYFEDLQGTSDNLSNFAKQATEEVRWHIRQLNLLCHEFESWALSYRKELEAPEWLCPSQLMCFLNAPRFFLDETDHELFGVETLDRSFGSVYVGVNKAVGKHHYEVFNDEGPDSSIENLVTTTLKPQTEAAGDFDIEWGRGSANPDKMKEHFDDFRNWLIKNNFDPSDKSLTIGHPKIGQVNLNKSFNTESVSNIWKIIENYLDVYAIRTTDSAVTYDYHWSDSDYSEQQIEILKRHV